MFGGINKTNRNNMNRRDISENSLSSRGNNRFIKTNNRYDETTYSVSSEEDSDESQKSINIKRQKPKTRSDINTNKTQNIINLELETIKIENVELKLKNDILMKLNNLSESVIKNSNLMIDICNEQKSISSRLDKLEQESKNKNLSKLVTVTNYQKNKTELNDDDILPIGDDSSLSILSIDNKFAVDDSLVITKPILLPKIEEKK